MGSINDVLRVYEDAAGRVRVRFSNRAKSKPAKKKPVKKEKSDEESGCSGYHTCNSNGDDFDCGYGTIIECDQCKYGRGRRDPLAKRNQPK